MLDLQRYALILCDISDTLHSFIVIGGFVRSVSLTYLDDWVDTFSIGFIMHYCDCFIKPLALMYSGCKGKLRQE